MSINSLCTIVTAYSNSVPLRSTQKKTALDSGKVHSRADKHHWNNQHFSQQCFHPSTWKREYVGGLVTEACQPRASCPFHNYSRYLQSRHWGNYLWEGDAARSLLSSTTLKASIKWVLARSALCQLLPKIYVKYPVTDGTLDRYALLQLVLFIDRLALSLFLLFPHTAYDSGYIMKMLIKFSKGG